MPKEQLRVTPGGIRYILTPKRVKNYNLRIGTDGCVHVSAPPRAPLSALDAFVDGHRDWIAKAYAAQEKRQQAQNEPLPDRRAALELFTGMSDRVYPLFAQVLGGQKPQICVRDMTTRWGVCNVTKKKITFALRLYDKPAAAQIYVVVHEYCHFLQANHSPAFWREVERILPDWRERRALLKDR